MVVFFVKSNENTYPKGRALMQIELSLKRKEGIAQGIVTCAYIGS